MTKQSRKHMKVVQIEKSVKNIKRRNDRCKTNLMLMGTPYYRNRYENIIKTLMRDFIKVV